MSRCGSTPTPKSLLAPASYTTATTTPGKYSTTERGLSAERPLASPLTLIDDAERAEEVLLLTYSCNLAFWERFAVSRARALGALVTVVADPAVVDADPAAVRHSG